MEEKKGKWKKEVQNRVWNWKQKVGSVLWITGLALILIIEIRKEELEVTFLDVGQGDGIFLQTDAGLTCMIDGGSTDIKQVGKYRIEPFLKSKGVRKLDYVFVTHGDQDHLNGIVELDGTAGIWNLHRHTCASEKGRMGRYPLAAGISGGYARGVGCGDA